MHRILVIVLSVYLVVAALYAIRTPKWQAPDEPAHFNYIRTIAETGTLPVLLPGDYDQDYLERIKAAKFPPAMPVDSIRYEAYQPPLYYVTAVPFYLAARAGGIDSQVLTLRMFSVLLEVIVMLLAFAIVREIFPDDRLLALATVGALATIPMHIAVTASISNDTAAELVLALILWLAIRRLKHQIPDRPFVLLGGVLFGAALLTKQTTYVTGASLLVAAELGSWVLECPRSQASQARSAGTFRRDWRRPFARLIPLFLMALVLSSPMFIRNILTYGIGDPLGTARHDAVVVGQPTTAGMIAQKGLARVIADFSATSARSFWGQFGWMGVLMDERVYIVLFLLTALALLGLGLYVARLWRRRATMTAQEWWSLALMALLLLTAVVDYVGYNGKFFQPQGRYLFPAVIPVGLALVVGLREILSKEYARLLLALSYVMMVGLDIAALFLYIVPQLKT